MSDQAYIGTRRRGLFATATVFLAIGALVLAACAPAAPAATPPPAAATTPAAAPSPVGRGAGGTLRLLWWQAATILNPHLAQGTKDFDAARLVLEPLAAIAPDGKPVARLAAEVPTTENGGVSKDLKTITWKLKSGVKWSDGSAFTADDVVFTWQYMADPKTAATTASTVASVAKVEAVDASTVRVTFKEPNPFPYEIFASALGMIIQKNQFKDFTGEKAKDAPGNQKPIGTGPYKVTEFKPGDVVSYAINDQYREANKPFFKEVQFKGGGDATSAARAALQTGDIDYSWNLQVEASILKQLAEGGKGELVTAISPNVERLLLNRTNPNAPGDQRSEPTTKHPFLSDLNVRKALAMATDRAPVGAQLYGDGITGKASCNIITAPTPVVSKNTDTFDVCKFDLKKAEELLDAAGWKKGADGIRAKGGVRMEITFQTTVNPVRQKTQDIVKAGWEKLGIKVELRTIPASIFFSSDVANPDTAAKFFTDVEMFTNGSSFPDQTVYLFGWHSSRIAQKSNQWRADNYERYNNPEYDKLVEALQKETDSAKRNELTIKANDLLVQDVVIIPLVARNFPVAGKSKQLKGVIANPWDGDLWNVADWTK